MALIFRFDITKRNCWLCKYFRRDIGVTPNEGSCTECAPTGSGAAIGSVGGGTQNEVHAHIAYPSLTACKKFEPFEGEAREAQLE